MSIRSLWAMVQEDPIFMRKVNGWLVWVWVANIPPVIFIYAFAPEVWKQASILYLALVSIYANIAGHWAAWQAARVEVKQEEDESLDMEQVKAAVHEAADERTE